jgi:hypothetical protein
LLEEPTPNTAADGIARYVPIADGADVLGPYDVGLFPVKVKVTEVMVSLPISVVTVKVSVIVEPRMNVGEEA